MNYSGFVTASWCGLRSRARAYLEVVTAYRPLNGQTGVLYVTPELYLYGR